MKRMVSRGYRKPFLLRCACCCNDRGMCHPCHYCGRRAGLENKDQVILIQAALVVAALSTLLQLFPIGKKYRIGSGLPIIMGVSFAYVPSMQAIADGYGIDTILGAQIVGGVVAVIMGIMVKKDQGIFSTSDHRNSGIYHRTFPVSHCDQLHGWWNL